MVTEVFQEEEKAQQLEYKSAHVSPLTGSVPHRDVVQPPVFVTAALKRK